MSGISAAALGDTLAPATVHGTVGGATVHGRMGAAALGGSLGGVALAGSVSVESGLPPVYGGPYEATPRVDEQELPTQGRRMASDVRVRGIPYAEVSNESGGWTATIG